MLCTKAVAEAITIQLASNSRLLDSSQNEFSLSQLALTPRQELLQVPRALVFLAGLCTIHPDIAHDSVPHLTNEQQQQLLFVQLQKRYYESVESNNHNNHHKHKWFVLSPTVLPCPEAQIMIQRQVTTFVQYMERQSNNVAHSLVKEECKHQMKTKRPKPKKCHGTTSSTAAPASTRMDSQLVSIKQLTQGEMTNHHTTVDQMELLVKQKETQQQQQEDETIIRANDLDMMSEDISTATESEEDTDDDDSIKNDDKHILTNMSILNDNNHGTNDDKDDLWIQVKRRRSPRNESPIKESSFSTDEKDCLAEKDCLVVDESEMSEHDKPATISPGEASESDAVDITPSNEESKQVSASTDCANHNDDCKQATSDTGTQTDSVPTNENITSDSTCDNEPTAYSSTLPSTDTKHQDRERSSTHDTSNATSSVEALQQEIHQLKKRVQEQESQIEQDRQTHAKEIQTERDSMEERMQALQLRLYISETRSRTFEEALQQHISAVSSNVSMTPSKSSTHEEVPNSKPLYSRAECSAHDD